MSQDSSKRSPYMQLASYAVPKKWLMLMLMFIWVTQPVGCNPGSDLSRDELQAVVAQEAVFTHGEIPRELISAVKDAKAVLIGEYHDISGHQEFTADLAGALHEHGFRQILIEYPHATTWILEAAALGLVTDLPEGIARTYGVLINKVSRMNSQLPDGEKIRVAGFDLNTGNDFTASLAGISHQIGRPQILDSFINAVQNGEDYRQSFDQLQAEFMANKEKYLVQWGEKACRMVSEMIWGESLSLTVTCRQGSTKHAREREDVIKQVVDRYLAEIHGGIMINAGFYHVQKERAFGTRQQWLGEYLTSSCSAAEGNIYSMVVVPARGEMRISMKVQSFDLAETSPENELFSIIDGIAGKGIAFISLDHEIFTKKMLLNYHHKQVAHAPKHYFDGFVLLKQEVSYIGRQS